MYLKDVKIGDWVVYDHNIVFITDNWFGEAPWGHQWFIDPLMCRELTLFCSNGAGDVMFLLRLLDEARNPRRAAPDASDHDGPLEMAVFALETALAEGEAYEFRINQALAALSKVRAAPDASDYERVDAALVPLVEVRGDRIIDADLYDVRRAWAFTLAEARQTAKPAPDASDLTFRNPAPDGSPSSVPTGKSAVVAMQYTPDASDASIRTTSYRDGEAAERERLKLAMNQYADWVEEQREIAYRDGYDAAGERWRELHEAALYWEESHAYEPPPETPPQQGWVRVKMEQRRASDDRLRRALRTLNPDPPVSK